jgi:hypothetical protein
VAAELKIAGAKLDRLFAAKSGPVEQPKQRAIADPGRVAARRAADQRGGLLAAEPLRKGA